MLCENGSSGRVDVIGAAINECGLALGDLGESGGGKEREVEKGGYLIRGSLEAETSAAWSASTTRRLLIWREPLRGEGAATLEYKVPRRRRSRFTTRQKARLLAFPSSDDSNRIIAPRSRARNVKYT